MQTQNSNEITIGEAFEMIKLEPFVFVRLVGAVKDSGMAHKILRKYSDRIVTSTYVLDECRLCIRVK